MHKWFLRLFYLIYFIEFLLRSFHLDTFSGNVGLAISQSLILTGMVQFGVRQTTEAMQQMTSVERVLQYTDLEPVRTVLHKFYKTITILLNNSFLLSIENRKNLHLLNHHKAGLKRVVSNSKTCHCVTIYVACQFYVI